MSRPFASLLAALCLSACASPMVAPDVARNLDPLTLDFEQVRVFVTLPDGLRLRDGAPMLTLSARTDTAAQVTAPLVAEGDALRLRPADAAQFNILRDRLIARKAAGKRGSGGIALAVLACRTGDGAATGPIAIRAARTPGAAPFDILPPTNPAALTRATGQAMTDPCPAQPDT